MESFLQRGLARNLAPRTLVFYRTRLGSFVRWLEKQRISAAPGDATPSLVRPFLAAEMHSRTSPLARFQRSVRRRAWPGVEAWHHLRTLRRP